MKFQNHQIGFSILAGNFWFRLFEFIFRDFISILYYSNIGQFFQNKNGL